MEKITYKRIADKLRPLVIEIKISQGHGNILICSVDPPSLTDEIIQFLKEKFKAKVFNVRTPEDILKNLSDVSPDEIEVAIWKFPPSPERNLLNTLNIHRERFYETRVPHVMLFTRQFMSAVIKDAPDFWSYRGNFYEIEFPESKADADAIPSVDAKFWFKDREDLLRRKRIAQYLLEVSENDDEKVKALMDSGYSSYYLGSYDEALEHFKKALELNRKLHGDMHPTVAENYSAIGLALMAKGDYDAAIEFFEKALETFKGHHGENHPYTATLYNYLGKAYLKKGEYDRAIDFYNKALEIALKIDREDSPEIPVIYSNIGLIYAHKNENDRAAEYLHKALEAGREAFGEMHLFTATVHNNLGGVYYNMGNYDKAITHYKKALEIFGQTLGRENPFVARAYNNLGLVYKSIGKLDKAIENFKKALKIFEKTLGQCHPQIRDILRNLAQAYWDKGEKAEFERLMAKLAELERRCGE